MPTLSCVFLIGQLIEWLYHVNYPFSEAQDGYTWKKGLLHGLTAIIVLTALITTLIFTFKYKYVKIFTAFMMIALLSLSTLFIMTVVDGLKKLCGAFKC